MTAPGAGDLVETLEDMLLMLRSDAATCIRDLEPGNPCDLVKMFLRLLLCHVLNSGCNRYLTADRGMAQGVAQQVAQHLLESHGIGIEARKISGDIHIDRDTAID